MKCSYKLANVMSPLRRRGVSVGLAVVLAAPVLLSSVQLQGDEPSPPAKAESSPLTGAEMIFRGAENAVAGQWFTLEIFILNTSRSALKNLEFEARLDENIEQSKECNYRIAMEAIDPDDLHIVRLKLKPLKAGPGGMDIALRDKSGAEQHVHYVMPIAAKAPQTVESPPQGSPLRFKIAPLKECLAEQSGIVLVNVHNSDFKAMSKKLELVIAYETMGQIHSVGGPQSGFGGVIGGSEQGPGMRRGPVSLMPGNPTRKAEVSFRALEAGESCTLPVRLTPRRVGELGIAITAKDNPNTTLATARLPVRFNPDAPLARLLPLRTAGAAPVRLPKSLAEAPEVSLEGPSSKSLTAEEAFEHVAHLIEKINHVNHSKTDGYMDALVAHRGDLSGLPFTLGGACRLPGERGQSLQVELSRLRMAMANPATLASQLPNGSTTQESEDTIKARIAALVQVVEPEGTLLGQQMVKYLSNLAHGDATRALAKLTIFADDDKVRSDAVAALAKRQDKNYGDVFASGLNYPWPAVAQRTADAIAKLQLTDLMPQLIDVLERPDPRAPQRVDKDGQQVQVVREMVRINHLRNCLLCHAPANSELVASALPTSGPRPAGDAPQPLTGRSGRALPAPSGALTAPVPLPNQSLPTPTPSGGYGRFTVPDTLVAFDVTYLRQDFSVKLFVADAKPWPEQQRFDFLVRTRPVSEQEAEAYDALLQPTAAGELSPYHHAAATALRQLTGRDAAPTATAWRQLVALIKAETN